MVPRSGEVTAAVEVRQVSGGASNLTFSLRDPGPPPGHDLVLRTGPAGQKARGAHDMAREHRVQDGLADAFPLVPRMVALCEDESDYRYFHRRTTNETYAQFGPAARHLGHCRSINGR